MSDIVRLSLVDNIATITLNRPHLLNAMDGDMMRELRSVTEAVERDTSVRALVLCGEGAAFMAGGDVAVFHWHPRDPPIKIVLWGREMHAAFLSLRRMGKPVIASVHGAVAGAGFSLLCATDLAIAASDTKFSLAYSNIGASPDGGSTYFLPRLVGYKRAMELILLPDRFDADTALRYGLVNWVVPAEKLAMETMLLAQRLAAGPTAAYSEAKRLVNQSLEPLDRQMELELQAFSRCANGEDFKEGVIAFVQKRKPVFRGH
jgi:2-(1,2-epoxy-1,2-dihydrophenyl)acetyl-CoA isomerase